MFLTFKNSLTKYVVLGYLSTEINKNYKIHHVTFFFNLNWEVLYNILFLYIFNEFLPIFLLKIMYSLEISPVDLRTKKHKVRCPAFFTIMKLTALDGLLSQH